MSTSAYWKPPVKEKYGLSDTVKRVLSREYFNHDGSLSGKVILNGSDENFLKGAYLASGDEDFQELIDAIHTHYEIEFIVSN